jgi:hypothetical protein
VLPVRLLASWWRSGKIVVVPFRRVLPGTLAGTLIVAGGTALNRVAGLPLASVAASPRAVGEGRLWLLVSSGLLADDPWLASLVGFAISMSVVLTLTSTRVALGAAAAGQVGSTLIVYGVIACARLVDPQAFSALVDFNDYGLSAIIAAWIGVAAAILWRRHPTSGDHAAVIAGCLACLAIGLACRPDVTFLDSEHLVAFALGVAVAGPARRRRPIRSIGRLIVTAATSLIGRASI